MSELFKLLKKKSAAVEVITPGILAFEGMYPDYKKEIIPLVSQNDEIGIEIEVERVRDIDSPVQYPVWMVKGDNSLRDNGFEFITATPIKGNRITYALNQFFEVLDKNHRFSPRTSIHIHLNVLNLTCSQIATLLGAASLTENLLYRFVGGDRDKNNFCVPWYEANAYKLIEYFLDENLNFRFENYRYAGLNIDAIKKFGSLEFRHLGGTSDKVQILKWINLILQLKKFAVRTSWTAFKYQVDNLNTNSSYDVLVDNIYGPCKEYLILKTLAKDLERPAASLKKLKLDIPLMNLFVGNTQNGAHWLKQYKKKNVLPPPNTFWFNRQPPVQPRAQPRIEERDPEMVFDEDPLEDHRLRINELLRQREAELAMQRPQQQGGVINPVVFGAAGDANQVQYQAVNQPGEWLAQVQPPPPPRRRR